MATRGIIRLLAAIAVACGGVAAEANAQETYTAKTVRIVVSFAAGGPTDTVARVIGAKLGEMLGQQFFIENKVGAGGNIGADMAAKSPPAPKRTQRARVRVLQAPRRTRRPT